MRLNPKSSKEANYLTCLDRLLRSCSEIVSLDRRKHFFREGKKASNFPSLFGLRLAMLKIAALSACASDEYLGISLRSGEASTELQSLAYRARAGDKWAQVQLGIQYEEGRGVERDLRRARRLYSKAAQGLGATWVYVPSSVKGQHGSVLQVKSGHMELGLAEAQERLARLDKAR